MSRKVIRIRELATVPASANNPAREGLLSVSPATIWRWVREGRFPKPFKLGKSVTVWDAADIDAFIASRAKEDE